jgi:hypothetical protein
MNIIDRPIDRQDVENGNMVERYLADRLNDAELAQFEEHLLWCEETRREVDLAEDLAAGLRSVAKEHGGKRLWPGHLLSAAASAVLATGITLLVVNTSEPGSVGVTATNVLYVEPTRSADTWPVLEVSRADEWATLVVYPDFADFDRFRVVLERSTHPRGLPAGGGWEEVWEAEVGPGSRDSLVLSLRSSVLSDGLHRVRMQGRRGQSYQPAGEATFRVAHLSAG